MMCSATHCNTLRQFGESTWRCHPICAHDLGVCALQHTVTPCNTLQHTAIHCNTLQHTATHCNALQRTATHCDNLVSLLGVAIPYVHIIVGCVHCEPLQHTANHCNTLQHTATHCNTLQHTATHCNTQPLFGTSSWHCHPMSAQHLRSGNNSTTE